MSLSMYIATFFGSGLSPKAPGTVGSLACLPLGVFFLWLGGPIFLLYSAFIIFLIGLWTSDKISKDRNISDPQFIVIDEVAGQFIVLCGASINFLDIALAFIFFRLYDIIKPFPASFADKKLSGGLGIMLDDVFAGIYGFISLYVVKSFF